MTGKEPGLECEVGKVKFGVMATKRVTVADIRRCSAKTANGAGS
jgi:hypothetical protein